MSYNWKNKVALITGAATGIGALVTRNLVKEGVKHVAVLDVNEKAGINLQNELNALSAAKKYSSNVKFYKCDVTNDDQLLGSFDAVLKEQGDLDVVVNNAGVMNDAQNVYRKQIQINVTALVTGTLKALEIMGKDKGGKGGTVINVASIAALCQKPLVPIYFGTKAAVLQFSNCVGLKEYYDITGVRVVTICFGATDTPLIHTTNLGNFNETIAKTFPDQLKSFPLQNADNAAQGVVDVFKLAESGSTWISTTNRPVKDITATVTKAYGLLAEHAFQ